MTKGKLYYIMGPSGAGKDSVLEGFYNRLSLSEMKDWTIAQRYITRAADAGGENHKALDKDEFLRLEQDKFFLFSWHANGNSYGIGKDICKKIDSGKNVIINGSRGYLPQAQKSRPDLVPILITASPTILAKRLSKRGRESESEIARRLERSEKLEEECATQVTIYNEGDLDSAIDALHNVLIRGGEIGLLPVRQPCSNSSNFL